MLLDRLDRVSHCVLDPVINFKAFGRWHFPGWGLLQVWQWRLCSKVEGVSTEH